MNPIAGNLPLKVILGMIPLALKEQTRLRNEMSFPNMAHAEAAGKKLDELAPTITAASVYLTNVLTEAFADEFQRQWKKFAEIDQTEEAVEVCARINSLNKDHARCLVDFVKRVHDARMKLLG